MRQLIKKIPDRYWEWINHLPAYFFLFLFTFITFYPFFHLLFVAKGSMDLSSFLLYPDYVLRNLSIHRDAILRHFQLWRIVWNSFYIAGMSTFFTLLTSSLGGFSFAVYRFKGKEALFTAILATLMIPTIVSVVPYYAFMSSIGWIDTARSLYLPSMASAYGIFLLRKYIESSIQKDLLDCARIDGCGEFTIYWRIVLPVILPGLAALGILTFISVWSGYMLPLLFLPHEINWTLPLLISKLDQPMTKTFGVLFSLVPVSIVYFLFSKWIVAGFTMVSTKED